MAVFLSRLFVAVHSRIHVVVRLHASTLWSHWWTSLVGWWLCQQPPRYCTTSIQSKQHTQYCCLPSLFQLNPEKVGPTEINKSINSLQCVLIIVIMEIREANRDFVLKKNLYSWNLWELYCLQGKWIIFCVNFDVWLLNFLTLIFYSISVVLVGTLVERYCQLVGSINLFWTVFVDCWSLLNHSLPSCDVS